MSIRTAEELAGMQRAGALVARTLRVLARRVRAAITTGELDAVAARELARAGAVAGAPLHAIGRATERVALDHGGTVYPELHGHGVGRTMHEPPAVPNVFVGQLSRPLGDGLVLAIEPMLGLGGPELVTRDDGWTIATADGSLAAHVEHTVVVAPGGPLVLTT